MEEIKKVTKEDTFNKLFTSGKIEKISPDQVPKEAIDFFDGMGARFVPPEEYTQGNFEQLYVINHANGDITYIAEHEKQYDENNKEQNTYFLETRNGKEIGHGELRLVTVGPDEYFKQPYVGFTDTEKEYRRQGLGTRRVLEMGAYAKMQYSLPIHSDTLIWEKALKVWEKLEKEGKAEKVETGSGEFKYRYRLK
jgi:GNAT superfamily N-acetyltransferase